MTSPNPSPPAPAAPPQGDRRVRLPVHTGRLGNYRPQIKSRLRRWRGLSLVLVYVLMGAHVAHWLLAGRTLGPVVFSESMYALEIGRVNPGFVFFSVTLVATLLAGRFLCGWACHMAGLQELCGWILTKLGVRPRQFRVRLLGYVPLGLALYMFVWPTFKREALLPALARAWPEALGWFKPVAEFPGFKSALITDNLWSPLPGLAVCIVFLLISGFATVAFLGARGLCRYGCPYGGFLRYAEQVAPARIVVNRLACDGCGRCTAACTSGVRVLDEIRAYGMVVDPHCVRSLDCVSVCPTNALSFRITRPAIFKDSHGFPKPTPHYDTTWGEEFLVIGTFLTTLLVTRGLYGRISLLMAVSVAACVAFVAWKSWHVLRRADVRHFGLQLKRGGRLRPAGFGFLGLGALLLGLVAHSAVIRGVLARAEQLDSQITVSADAVFSGDPNAVPAETRVLAGRSLGLYRLGSSFTRGGVGLADTPETDVREAWLALVMGDAAGAETALRRAVGTPRMANDPIHRVLGSRVPTDSLAVDLARVLFMQGKSGEAAEYLNAVLALNPTFYQSLDALSAMHAESGNMEEARKVYTRALGSVPADVKILARLGAFDLALGQTQTALKSLQSAADAAPGDPFVLHHLARARFVNGEVDVAVTLLRQAATIDPAFASAHLHAAASMLRESGRAEEADALPGARGP